MPTQYKFYNTIKKQEFLKEYPLTSYQKQDAMKVFNKSAQFEIQKNKDLMYFDKSELINLYMETGIITDNAIHHHNVVIKKYCEFNNLEPIDVFAEEVKTTIIKSGRSYHVINEADLCDKIIKAISHYNDDSDNYDSIDFTNFFMMAVVYKILQYHRLSDEEILTIKKTDLLQDWTLPNGELIESEQAKKLIKRYINTKYYEYSNTHKTCVRYYSPFEVEDDRLLRSTIIQATGRIIEPNLNSLAKKFNQLSVYNEQLSERFIKEAALFNKAFVTEFYNGIYSYELTEREIRAKKDYYDKLLETNQSTLLAEKYCLYKAVRFNNNI